jgi:hypothetical protein
MTVTVAVVMVVMMVTRGVIVMVRVGMIVLMVMRLGMVRVMIAVMMVVMGCFAAPETSHTSPKDGQSNGNHQDARSNCQPRVKLFGQDIGRGKESQKAYHKHAGRMR